MKKRKLLWLWLPFLAVIGTVTASTEKGAAHTKSGHVDKPEHTNAVAVISKGAAQESTPALHRRWKCVRLGRVSTKKEPNNRCWYYCFNSAAYRVYRLPEKNGTPCKVYKGYPAGTCRFSRCRQPGRRRIGWLHSWIFHEPKRTKK